MTLQERLPAFVRGGRRLPVLHADAAGIDIGGEEIFVAVPSERAVDWIASTS
jgi:hypothetical protein